MLWGERRRLTALASDASDPLERQVAQRAARRGLWVPWLYNLRLHALTTQICRRVRPIAAVTLYEGHAREGLVWHAARLANPWCLAVGYQHTILRKNAHGVRRRPEGFPEFGPDWLWSMGDRGRDDLAACPGLREVPVRTYGTHRRPGGSALADEPQAEKTVLVLPEGLWNEAVTLFGFALRAARKNPEVRFILRCHPVLPFERLQDHLPDFDPDAANVEISRRPAIEDDFGRSGYLLYRGSSTVIYGILAGLRPLYLDQPGQMDLDPLYSLQGWRERIGTEAALSAVLDRDGRCSTEERRREWTKARDFCLAMARPVNPDAVDEMIEAARDRRRRLSGRFNQAG
jgi:hypothetical protein